MTRTMGDFFEPIDETSLRDQVATNIRRAIDAGVLKPGERLVEANIAAQMGISRAPVREAIQLLQQEGCVISIPRKGTFVVELTREDFEEIYSLRSVLETFAIQRTIPRMEQEDTDALAELVDEMRKATQKREFSKLVDCELEFHRLIVALAGHKRLYDIWLQMSTQLRLFLTMRDQLFPSLSNLAEAHQPLLEAIHSRNVDLASQLIGQYIVHAGRSVLENLDDELNRESG